MLFSELAKYLQKLEGTSSRNEMTVILAELFKEASPEDARLIAYLSQGRLGPAYNSPDTGVADKMMLKALGEKAGTLFKQKGDLGLVAEELKSQKSKVKSTTQNLKVVDVYERLLKIAQDGGIGSQERKQELIRKLLDELDPIAAKYAVKIILGKLRTGFSDMTVLDSLSWMLVGSKKLKSSIESMYNVRADLGEIAKIVKDQGPKLNVQLSPIIGTPILMARAERAKTPQDIWERNGKCAVEYKLDGLRIQAHVSTTPAPAGAPPPKLGGGGGVVLYSRGLENVTHMYPDIAEGLAKQIKHDCIVEGEMIAVGSNGRFLPFQETVQRKRKYDIAEMAKKVPLKIFLFDVLEADGKDVMHLSNSERRNILENIIYLTPSPSPKLGEGNKKGEVLDIVQIMPRTIAQSTKDIEIFFEKAIKAGTEGIIAKKFDGPYQAGARDFNWIKYKKSYTQSALSDTIDAVVMGYDVGQGKRVGFGIGDFLIGVYQPDGDSFVTIAKVGTGLTDEEWREMKIKSQKSKVKTKPQNYQVSKQMECDFWVEPKIVVEILADEITKSPMHTSGYALRFPRLVTFREKKPEDATTVAELKKMVKLQEEGR